MSDRQVAEELLVIFYLIPIANFLILYRIAHGGFRILGRTDPSCR